MPMTAAERQRNCRRRAGERLASLEAEVTDLSVRLAAAVLERDAAVAEAERLSGLACRHPAGAVDGSRCLACGADVW